MQYNISNAIIIGRREVNFTTCLTLLSSYTSHNIYNSINFIKLINAEANKTMLHVLKMHTKKILAYRIKLCYVLQTQP